MIVYLITNIINNKKYVGQTVKSLKQRWRQHCYDAKKGCNYYFHTAIRKYGEHAFKLEVLCVCDDKASLDAREREYIAFYHTRDHDKGYNLTDGGGGSSGYIHTPEARRKQAETTRKQFGITPQMWYERYLEEQARRDAAIDRAAIPARSHKHVHVIAPKALEYKQWRKRIQAQEQQWYRTHPEDDPDNCQPQSY